jgi:release factor glutamine methyltransferase
MTAVSEGMTVGAVLCLDVLDSLERRILVSHALGLSRVQLITQSERALTSPEALAVSTLFERRLAGEPIAYIIGEREFYGMSIAVTPDVLIPRPETELLVGLALEKAPPQANVLDMGTGSGAIAIAIAYARPDLNVTALDRSLPALQIAQQNAERHKAPVRFVHSDWYGALDKEERFDVIVSNPPYIVAGDIHLSQGDLRFEPIDALTDHTDGLSALRIIIEGAPQYLKHGGWLMMEHGYDQAEAVRGLLNQAGFSDVQSWKDLASIERVSGGRVASNA